MAEDAVTVCAKAGLAFGTGQAAGNAFTFLVLTGLVLLVGLLLYRRIMR